MRKIVAIPLVIVIFVMNILVYVPEAKAASISWYAGPNVIVTFTGNALIVSGTGDMYSSFITETTAGGPWRTYCGLGSNVALCSFAAADVTKDTKVDIFDILAIQRHILGIEIIG